ncbi:MAG: PaaI family thioesterase, partial [Gammaproteobacteria bacterium]|nr:PaaI family thioesterase [Gammaproteobacteria bacterium]
MSGEQPSSIFDTPTLYAGTYLEFLGFKLIDWKPGFAKLEMPVRDDHRNTVGYLHGGVISSLL